MHKHITIVATLVLAFVAFSGAARAQYEAIAAPGLTNLRSGPGTNYRILARVRGGTYVHVYGCLRDISWCDVDVYGTDGWMAASRLQFIYRGRRYWFRDAYRYFDFPIIEFRRKYKRRKRPPIVGPATPPCPFPDPRECQPLGGNAAPGGGGPDYPPGYRSGSGNNVRRGDPTVPSCPPSDPRCLSPGTTVIPPPTGGPDLPPAFPAQ